MGHISMLGLFDYVAGRANLAGWESDHLQECYHCSQQAAELQRIAEDSIDISKARGFLAEYQQVHMVGEPRQEVQREQRD